MMDVLLGLERLSRRLAEHGTQLCRRLFPLGATQAFGAHDELALGRDDDDQLSHGES
jgi:hypothetical protein